LCGDGFDSLSFSDLVFYKKMLEDKRANDERGRYIAAAYGVWLTWHGAKPGFSEYVRMLGIVSSEKITPEQRKGLSEKSRKIADRIMRLDKGRKSDAKNIRACRNDSNQRVRKRKPKSSRA
jgi:hypothetical protein